MSKPDCQSLKDIKKISNTSDLRKWIQEQVQCSAYNLKYLLAHAEDGVIWGYFDSQGNLITPTEYQNFLVSRCDRPKILVF